jgi:universal stress protein A
MTGEKNMLPIQTILHPTDFSECSRAAFRMACLLARDQRARVIVLHVVAPEVVSSRVIGGPTPNVYRAEIEEHLNRFRHTDPRVGVEPQLAEGDVDGEILRVAHDSHCDMIVLGTHGRSGLGRILMGSVAEAVLRKAKCPVLVVKAIQHEPEEKSSTQVEPCSATLSHSDPLISRSSSLEEELR